MNFKIKNILYISLSLSLASCSKSFIERDPVDPVEAGSGLSTASAMSDALSGVYASYRDPTFYGRDLVIIGDIMADNTYLTSSNAGYYLSPYTYNIVNNDSYFTEIWQQGYKIILNTNKIIEAPATDDPTSIGNIRSQAYALRALAYFKLVNIYGRTPNLDPSSAGVSIVLTDSSANKPARSTVSEVYKQIISDYKSALDSAIDYSSSVTISQYAIEGLLAKAYMYSGDYTNALASAQDVINNSGFTLVDSAGFKNFWNNAAVQSSQKEVMFEIDANAINNNGSDDYAGMYENGYDQIYCDSSLYASYDATDVRRSLIVANQTQSGRYYYTVNKFPNANQTDRDNIKVIRLGEVYLIAAESAYRLGDKATAISYLNDLEAARNPSFAGYSTSSGDLLSLITAERRKELAFEGDRFYDLNRLQETLNRDANPIGGYPISNPNYITMPYSYYKRIAPIPLVELNANKNMVQNPGY